VRAFLAWDVTMVYEFMASSSCIGWFPDPVVILTHTLKLPLFVITDAMHRHDGSA
jgi:hypothetical protein